MLNATRLLLVAPGSSAVLQMSFVCSAPSHSRANGNHLSAAPSVSKLEDALEEHRRGIGRAWEVERRA